MTKAIRGAALLLALAVFAGAADPQPAGAQTKSKDKAKDAAVQEKDKAAATGAMFELYKDTAGEFRFRMRDGDGNLLATSGKGYKEKADCQKVIDTIKQFAGRAKVDDQSK